MDNQFILSILGAFEIIFVSVIAILIIYLIALYIIDVTQTKQAIRRNYPVIGRFRYFFEHMGTFFRQYFFAMDREELPFNRAFRSWVYRAAKNLDLSNAFGSTNDNQGANTPAFLNSSYPVLDEDQEAPKIPIIGQHCQAPYQPGSYFNISGMSYGALSRTAVTALSKGAEKAKCWLNTGEGGLSSYHLAGKADIVFQIGTANYGVRDENGMLDLSRLAKHDKNPQIKMFELKLSQGAKPGKGGILPAEKVNAEIAEIRGIPEGQASISPNRHKNINNDDDLLAHIARIKGAVRKPVGIKFVLGSEQWIKELCIKIAERPVEQRPDFITLDGAEGGTGAAPQALMDYVGLPIRISLPMVAAAIRDAKLDLRLICAGKLITPGSVAWALCSGADFVNSARGFMFSLGCIQAMQCNKNTCPTGITTHDKDLQKGLNPEYKSVRVANYHNNMIKNVEMIAHSCGLKSALGFSQQNVRMLNPSEK